MADVLEELSEVQNKWIEIGIQLRVPTHTLQGIEGKNSSSSNPQITSLREMLTFCINQKRTRLDDLVKTLRSRTVNEPVCAERFEGLVEDLKQSELVRSVAYINFYINICMSLILQGHQTSMMSETMKSNILLCEYVSVQYSH